jgi:acetyl esterase/lipase
LTVGLVVALGIGAPLVVIAWGRDSSSDGSARRGATATTATTAPSTTPTTVGPQTVPVPPTPPPPPSTGPPPAITVPPTAPPTAPETTPPTAPQTTPRTTPEPTVTAAPGSTTSRPGPTTSRPARITRRTVVYSPPGAPKRQATLVLPRQHTDTIVVLAHGASGNGGSRRAMRGWADFYAERGYPSFAIDYLLAKASTPSPVYPKPETDVKAAVQYLRGRAGQLEIDPDRIMVQGFAAGAGLGAQAIVTPDDPFFDGAGRYPNVSDKPDAFIGFYGRYDGDQQNATRYYGGPPDSSDPRVQARYAKSDSIAQAQSAAGPVLLLQGGGADNPDPTGQAGAFSEALQGAGKDVTLSIVPDASAYFDQEEKTGALTAAGRDAAQAVVEWLAARFPPN